MIHLTKISQLVLVFYPEHIIMLLIIVSVPSDFSQAFKQARRDEGFVFFKRADVDIEKVKQSKYFQSFLRKSKGGMADILVLILPSRLQLCACMMFSCIWNS